MALLTLDNNQRKLSAPTFQLSGHSGDVLCTKFSPCGEFTASAGSDKLVLVWDIFRNCQNLGTCKGHKNSILDLKWGSQSLSLITASADKCIMTWDTTSLTKARTFKGHDANVNSVDLHEDQVVSASDDSTVKLWDQRVRQ